MHHCTGANPKRLVTKLRTEDSGLIRDVREHEALPKGRGYPQGAAIPSDHICSNEPNITGSYGPRTADPLHGHRWRVRVYAKADAKVIAAYAKSRDGFEADLNEVRIFYGWGRVATFDTFARFRRKHFRWGDAVSFLHADYQDGPDVGKYVPDNDHLSYEVWGVTRDRQHTVVASVSVTHPKLAKWGPDVRVADSIEALKRDRDYKLIETCRRDEFEPSLAAFDRLMDTLRLE